MYDCDCVVPIQKGDKQGFIFYASIRNLLLKETRANQVCMSADIPIQGAETRCIMMMMQSKRKIRIYIFHIFACLIATRVVTIHLDNN